MNPKQEHQPLPQNYLMLDLKHEVEALKKKLSQPDTKSQELVLEIESLKDAVHKLDAIFEKALKEMKEEDFSKTLHDLMEKVTALTSQNQALAQGMTAWSDKLDALVGRPMPRPAAGPSMLQHTMGTPMMPGRFAPRPEMAAPSMPPAMPATTSEAAGFPPPPPAPTGKKRVGLF